MGEKTSTHTHQTDLQLGSSEPNIDIYATKRWYNQNEQLHREDGPAVERSDGTKEWYKNGKRHRENAPAIELANGTKFWFLNGKVHREDGPAREWVNGTKEWYQNGEIHREYGPAIEWANGSKEWYQNGEWHREDGPALEYANGRKDWYLKGKRHREDGPAIEWANGNKDWYLNGESYRREKAVVEWSDDVKEWTLPDLIELGYAEIELESLPEVFEDTQTLSFQDGGTVYDQDGWLHLEGLFHRHELESLLALIAPCIKIPIPLILKEPNIQGDQTLTLDKNGVYDQLGHEIALDPDNCA
jgi:hypothetical protein